MTTTLQISPPNPLRDGEGRPAAATRLAHAQDGGGRLNLRRERRLAPAGLDWFRTPAWATQALLERETFPGTIWECAAGDGAMAKPLSAAGYDVHATDLMCRGYGLADIDFLHQPAMPPGCRSVVTNPPYSAALPFVLHALNLRAEKIAMLLRLAFLEGDRRHRSLFRERPPCRVWVFSRRVTMWRGDDPAPRDTGGATPHAWFVWDRHTPGSQVGWIA